MIGLQLVFRILILAGFLPRGDRRGEQRSRPLVVRAIPLVFSAAIFVITWVVPLRFMIVMCWSSVIALSARGET